jgi:protein SCO1/2
LVAAILLLPFVIAPAAGAQHASLGLAKRRQVDVPIRDFVLTDQNGRPFAFKELRGKVVAVNFAYTTCPDVCPLLTAAMRRIQEGLSAAERASVSLVTVTTDPEIDNARTLSAYATRYSADTANWSFVTGREQDLQPVWKNFGVAVRKLARGLVDHTALTALVDQNGRMRVAYHGGTPDERLVLADVRSLLAKR